MKKRVRNSNVRRISIEISKKNLYTIGIIIIFLIGVSAVVAFGSTPSVNGHSYSELQTCGSGQILKSDASGNWGCGADNTGGITFRTGSVHTNSNGVWIHGFVGKNKQCFTYIQTLTNTGCGSPQCNYNSGTGNIDAYTDCDTNLFCGWVCLN